MLKYYHYLRCFALLLVVMTASPSWARPGWSKPVDVRQPDGTTVTLLMHGDEFLHFMTTTDGYTVVKGDNGFYQYAEKTDQGQLRATGITAKNAAARNPQELAFLNSQKKMVSPDMTEGQRELKQSASRLYHRFTPQQSGGMRKAPSIWPLINYDQFKGLVVLVEFSDRKFSTDDPKEFYLRMTNQEHLYDNSLKYYPVPVEGSVRDYFRDNSMGKFNPTFDVVGPVQISMKSTDVGGQSVTFTTLRRLITSAINQIDSTVDFRDYDLDDNGIIDMIYFVFAGYGSYVQGNNEKYLWPHANDFSGYSWQYGMRYDGKYFGRYACSVEIQDYEEMASQHVWLDGIGTMCHEFSHVLGLADHYDANYEEDGQANDPDGYDIMANGADYNYGLSPVGYNAFERYMLEFADDHPLDVAGNYELEPFNESNQFFRIMTGAKGEDFFIENRQQRGWDRYLPGHGLLAWRADTSNPTIWTGNSVNNKADHMYFELLSAQPGKAISTAYTPFPGTSNAKDLTATTTPALRSWAGMEASVDLYDITETKDGLISFRAGKELYESSVEDFEQTALTENTSTTGVKGTFCDWDFSNGGILSTTETGKGNGQHVAALYRSGTMTTSELTKGVRKLSFKLWNGSTQTKVSLRSNQDGSWKYISSTAGQTQTTLSKNSETELTFNGPFAAGSKLQIQLLGQTSSVVGYVDDINVMFTSSDDASGIANLHETKPKAQPAYSITGQRVDTRSYQGIVIQNGRKQLKR